MTLTLPLPPNAANSRRAWQVVLRDKKRFWASCDAHVMAGLVPQPPKAPPARVRLSVTLYVWNPMDADNSMSRLKVCVDWLKRSGYITDDGRKHLEWAGIPEQVIDRRSPRVVITITPMESP